MDDQNSWNYLRKIIFKEINEMRKLFKIGDKVTIRADLKTGMNIRFNVNDEMEKLAGKEATVIGDYDNKFKLNIDNGEWTWNMAMFAEFHLILKKHKKWLVSEPDGERADLSNVDLSNADLSNADLRNANLIYANLIYADLRNADLSNANLIYANLRYANLSNANLIYANLRYANLIYADLRNANLIYANLIYADLRNADLSNANLIYANLRYANLSNANLIYANLRYANLIYADLRNADLRNADLRNADIHINCPEKGSFIGFKKAQTDEEEEVIVELLITEDAKRSSATSRKCRCSKAKVLSITSLDETEQYNEAYSSYDNDFIYEVGKTVEPDSFDEDRFDECSNGIHFFITRQEAVDY